MKPFALLHYSLAVMLDEQDLSCLHLSGADTEVSQVSNGTKAGSVCRMMEKELHFLHDRPQQALPERVSDYTGLQKEVWELMSGSIWVQSWPENNHLPSLAVIPTDQAVVCG